MKKSLLSILALALVAVGCQNYDDQFDSLNADIAALTTKVNGLDAGVAAQVTAVAASVANLATQVTALGNSALTTTDLTTALTGVLTNLATVQSELTALDSSVATSIAGVNTNVAALTTQLTAVQTSALTSADIAALDEVTGLNAEMAAVQSALDELLAAQASVNANISITNQAELDYTETLMETDGTPANYIINGSVTIDAATATNYTAGTDYIAAISLLTSKIASVIGTVTITTTSSTAALDLGQLTYVSNDFEVNGNFDADASVLTTALSVHVDVNASSFALPNLISAAGGVRLDDVTTATVSPLTVNIVNLTTGAVTTANGALQFPDADVNLGAGSPAADTDVKSIIATGVAALASADIEASGDVTIGALTVTATVIDGANITLQSGAVGSTWGGGSTINATGDIIVNALTINGGASTITNDGGAGGGMTLGAKLIKNLTAVASGTGVIDVSAMEDNQAGSYSAADVTLTGLVTNTGLLTVLVDTNIQLDALIAGAGAITAEAASTLNAPLFPTDGTINLKNGTAGVANGADVTVKSLTAIADLADAATIKSLTIGAQPANVSLVLSTFVAMSTLNYKGVAAASAAGQTNDLTIGPMVGGSASLTTIDFTGNGGISNLTVMAAGLTSLSTVGALRSITVTSTGAGATAAALDAITIGNTGLNGGTAGVVSITQTGISSLDLSGWNWIKAIELIGNTSMTALTFPSATTTATSAGPGVNKTVTVTANGIAGAITAPVDSTESNVFVESILTGVGFTNAKTWLTWITNQSTGGGVTYTLEIDADDTDIQAVCDDGGVDGVAATAIWNSTSEIDIIGELGLLSN